jgi:ubiquinone/menaquinone biosynthesis C-methylase UbiE
MQLIDLINRDMNPLPWSEGDNIPWHEPEFSKRMLAEHLTQDHDLASRRFEIIDKHVSWIHQNLLNEKPSKILDICCGPGFYTQRFARLGHTCLGIDYSPASIEYASKQNEQDKLDCAYLDNDIRQADYGSEYDLVSMIYGEFNVFKQTDINSILKKAYTALKDHSQVLFEAHTFAAIKRIGDGKPSWFSSETGLFSPRSHICLDESTWNFDQNVAIKRFYVIDSTSSEITKYSSSYQAYTDKDYQNLLEDNGFNDVRILSSLEGNEDAERGDLIAIVARKR